MTGYLLALDQGTTSSRAMIFDLKMRVVAMAQQEFPQHYPASGWVEHDPEDLWQSVLASARAAMAKAGLTAASIAAIGIANQRETTLIWDRETGRPIHNALVWQDRRTAEACARLKAQGLEPLFTGRTGLLLDPYFSATKIAWLLDKVPGARAQAVAGRLAFGTVDSFLLWRLTGGQTHATDATNAARSLLFDIHQGRWDPELCAILDIPTALLPEVLDSAADFGVTLPEFLGGPVAIRGVAGDQQAAVVGQACFAPGMIKATYGTGCFALLNTGKTPVASRNRLLTTIACQLKGQRSYALEGAIFVAGAAVQWLRDGLGVIAAASEAGALAERADPEHGLYFVPAFVGLGAPHWDAQARGAIYGLSRGSTHRDITRAALEAVGYQTADLVAAMFDDWQATGAQPIKDGHRLRVDGGMAASDWAMQWLADILDQPVDRAIIGEATALGAAYLAGLGAGLAPEPEEFAKNWQCGHSFQPRMAAETRSRRLAGWHNAIRCTRRYGAEAGLS